MAIVILAVLLTLGLGNYFSSQAKSRDARRKADLQNVARALEVYYNDKGVYPVSAGNAGIAGQAWGDPFVDPDNENETIYMNVLPTDPSDGAYYYTSADGRSYQLYARLENQQDGDLSFLGQTVLVYSGTDCILGVCNYGISSTNAFPETGHPLLEE